MSSSATRPMNEAASGGNAPALAGDALKQAYDRVRRFTHLLCEPLEVEDFVIQSMPDVSPTRWHLAHTTWFFETFVLKKFLAGYEPTNTDFEYLFNSYYNTVNEPFPRPRRGLLSRPTVKQVFDYRGRIDQRMHELFDAVDIDSSPELAAVIEIGLHHEQQHQELMLTDIKHVFSCNPLYPAYRPSRAGDASGSAGAPALRWIPFDEGLREIGYGGDGFCYDNERPRHRVFLEAFELADRLVTNAEYIEFIEDGGYERPELWLSDGWATVGQHGWNHPLYWQRQERRWRNFTLSGIHPVDPRGPVCHVSYYEADAYARWAGARLPTEAEWEVASSSRTTEGKLAEDEAFHPAPLDAAAEAADGLHQMIGDVWEWTGSQYLPYPGYQPPAGALGEYNGKFMCNQFVLRGGSCVTSRTHIRPTYRNFFPPDARWQFSGIRLAK